VKLQDQVALITGTSPNIGGGIAEGLANEGAKVVCVDISPDNANQCAASIVQRGGQAIGVVYDVTNEAQVKATVDRTTEAFGGVDLLINSAVIFNQKGVLDMSLDEWTRQTSIILTGTFLFTKYVAQLMVAQQRRDNIINVISTAGHQGQPRNVGYCTGKSGLLNFTRLVAIELVDYGIRVKGWSVQSKRLHNPTLHSIDFADCTWINVSHFGGLVWRILLNGAEHSMTKGRLALVEQFRTPK
jgi:NAD(P)-dependent dehydrogenase (short-subunit alcohol dehydrogenase family)